MNDLDRRSHPLRASLSAEMHVRRLPRLAAPCRLLQVVALLGEHASRPSRAYIAAIAAERGHAVADGSRFEVLALGDGITLVWEGHSEAATLTLIRPGDFADPFDPGDWPEAAARAVAELPGQIVRATQVAVLPPDRPLPDREGLARWFDPDALTVCQLAGGRASMAADFKLHPDGYGRLLLNAGSLEGDELSQLVERMQEHGNYRNMTLLGLPVAQRLTPEVTALEQRLSALTQQVAERTASDESLLGELTAISGELARIAAATRYRMSATRAYATLSMERLRSLDVSPIRGFQTLVDFTERRLAPARRTCESFVGRLEDLSQRAAWTSSLLRTRIDIALAQQNRDLLASMDRRTQLQLRLQQAVEGLSVVAISYYVVSLIGYLATPAGDHAKKLATAVAVPIVVSVLWLALRRFRRDAHE